MGLFLKKCKVCGKVDWFFKLEEIVITRYSDEGIEGITSYYCRQDGKVVYDKISKIVDAKPRE